MHLTRTTLVWILMCYGKTFATTRSGQGSDDEERLIIDLFRGYNHLIRPVLTVNATPIEVSFGLAIILLINVDEKNQVMQTNVWLTMRWSDFQMVWNPKEYGGITTIRVPPDKVWLPDLVLFNNADGNYEVSFHSNVVISNTGEMLWVPPAIYKSSCRINVEYFPFDEQTCSMIFGSWTYKADEVQLSWYQDKNHVELNDYSYSGIWDVMDVPGERNSEKSKITFHIRIRRKTLFYTVILIIPTVLMAFLSMMVFYLPADCSEKITLAISILLALVVFLLLVSKILPPTSDTIPLMAKYLLMTFIMNIITILITVIIINIYFRGPTTHVMPPFVHYVFLVLLPRLLLMKRPKQRHMWSDGCFLENLYTDESVDPVEHGLVIPAVRTTFVPAAIRSDLHQDFHTTNRHHPNCHMVAHTHHPDGDDSVGALTAHGTERLSLLLNGCGDTTVSSPRHKRISDDARRALAAIEYITDHLRRGDDDKRMRDDWKYVAMVVDRLLLYIFFGVTVGGTIGILMSAPNVFKYVDQEAVIKRLQAAVGSEDEERLIIDIFKGYNHLIRPVQSANSTAIVVSFSLAMILLINVDEKNQIMQTNVWLTMKWPDFQLKWDPLEYGDIETIRVPPDKVWLPDIVLFNNADGNYEVSFYSNVVISHTGEMLWVPPAIYKSSCTIDVEFFPFDEQDCAMIFGSWTFRKDEVTIDYLDNKNQVELNDYSYSGIWDIMDVPGELIEHKSKIQYMIKIRRKTLFYTVILIIPTVLMAFLSMMVFYLPAEASEKITLAISILLALVVFLLLVSKILPPTSSTIPLMAKYLLLTFVMNIITILVTVVIINVYFRGPTTHRMAPWIKVIFLEFLPKFLMMQRPKRPELALANDSGGPPAFFKSSSVKSKTSKNGQLSGGENHQYPLTSAIPGQFIEMADIHHPYCHQGQRQSSAPPRTNHYGSTHDTDGYATTYHQAAQRPTPPLLKLRASSMGLEEDSAEDEDDDADMPLSQISPEAYKAIEAIEYITEHLKQDDEYKKVRDDWKYVAMVIDRLLLYIFFGVTAGGTFGILLSAPNVFQYVDQKTVIDQIKNSAGG